MDHRLSWLVDLDLGAPALFRIMAAHHEPKLFSQRAYGFITRQQLADAERAARRITANVTPDETIARRRDQVFFYRWWLSRPPADRQSANAVYLHRIMRSDAWPPHTHPWPSFSLHLGGSTLIDNEYGPLGELVSTHYHRRGQLLYRPAGHCHQLLLHGRNAATARTLVFTGPREVAWGFLKADGTTTRNLKETLHG